MTKRCLTIRNKSVCTNEINKYNIQRFALETIIEIAFFSILVNIFEFSNLFFISILESDVRSFYEAGLIIVVVTLSSFFVANLLGYIFENLISNTSKSKAIVLILISSLETIFFIIVFYIMLWLFDSFISVGVSNFFGLLFISLTVISLVNLIMDIIYTVKKSANH